MDLGEVTHVRQEEHQPRPLPSPKQLSATRCTPQSLGWCQLEAVLMVQDTRKLHLRSLQGQELHQIAYYLCEINYIHNSNFELIQVRCVT